LGVDNKVLERDLSTPALLSGAALARFTGVIPIVW
jgi:hypothetical protein